MEIRTITEAQMDTATATAEGRFNIAVNHLLPYASVVGSKADPSFLGYFTQADGTAPGDLIGGTSDPIVSVQPSFFPVATKGAECAAVVDDLSWADSNLYQGYEWFQCKEDTTDLYFVSGILNSSQTLSNDPFASTQPGMLATPLVSCWAGDYSVGINPFL